MQPTTRNPSPAFDPSLLMELDLLPPEPSSPAPEHVRRLVDGGEDAVVVRMGAELVVLVRTSETARSLDALELHAMFHRYDGVDERPLPWLPALTLAARTWRFAVYHGSPSELRRRAGGEPE